MGKTSASSLLAPGRARFRKQTLSTTVCNLCNLSFRLGRTCTCRNATRLDCQVQISKLRHKLYPARPLQYEQTPTCNTLQTFPHLGHTTSVCYDLSSNRLRLIRQTRVRHSEMPSPQQTPTFVHPALKACLLGDRSLSFLLTSFPHHVG